MPKFFVDGSNISANKAKIIGGDVKHITKVLRLPLSSILTLCDGEGFDYVAKISAAEGDTLLLDILEKKASIAEPALKVTLFQGVPKNPKMEYIVEKCTELGADSICPVITKRSVVKFDSDAAAGKKLERWRKIASESVKQCARGAIPFVYDVHHLEETQQLIKELDVVLVAYENEKEVSLKNVLSKNREAKSLGIFIGPEGGFSDDEISFLKSCGCETVTLGNRILRTETAGPAVLAAVMYEFDEMQ